MFLVPPFVNSIEKPLRDLSELQWENRVLLIWAEDMQESSVEDFTYEIDDRDLIWFLFSKAKVISNYKGEISDTFFATTTNKYHKPKIKLILIGKDGGIKSIYSSINLPSVFKSIDVMSMRQSEIKNRPPNS
ncbi:DUF4174 domain-containing protein [uncultured Vibrio sp.]|uniref:DUF4174 domain-containing protein n=1 Tax=uncultured Vibrio sp. TaxID=114054 RepID=UPI0025E7AA84|nr:DUF4174 domain-containing protein [uncultured Vibrio sp.]